MNEGFPWARLMELGLGSLRLPPERFWQMTLPELSAAARSLQPQRPATLSRGTLDEMMQLHPDKEDDHEGK